MIWNFQGEFDDVHSFHKNYSPGIHALVAFVPEGNVSQDLK